MGPPGLIKTADILNIEREGIRFRIEGSATRSVMAEHKHIKLLQRMGWPKKRTQAYTN